MLGFRVVARGLKLKNIDGMGEFQEDQIRLLELSLKDICSPFLRKATNTYVKLTPREIEISNMVKNGFTNKEIANVLCLSLLTVEKHRQYIRKKLGITDRSINLCSYLQYL